MAGDPNPTGRSKTSSSRENYLKAKRGDLTRYAGMIADEFKSKVDRLSQIIGTAHEQSVGEYKESLLRSCIKQFVPQKYTVGTGFIIFGRDHSDYDVSHQLDVVVFDNINYETIFQDRDLVIVRPESVRAIVEVKGFLRPEDVKKCITKYVTLGKSWLEYSDSSKLPFPALLLMAWNTYTPPKAQYPTCDGGILRRVIVEAYRKKLRLEEMTPYQFPLLNGAYIYNDCAVELCAYVDFKDEKVRNAYSTYQGRIVRHGAILDADATVMRLLTHIYIHLDVPFNPLFANSEPNVNDLPHEKEGMTALLTGADVRFCRPPL